MNATFKVEFLSSHDYKTRLHDASARVTVLLVTLEAEDHDDAVLKTHKRFPDSIVLATYQQELTPEGAHAGFRP